MKFTSFWDAMLGDASIGYVPLGRGLHYSIAERIRRDLDEVSPGYVLTLRWEAGRWWLGVARSSSVERVAYDG